MRTGPAACCGDYNHGRAVVVADSNRFNSPGAHATLTVVDATAALAHQSAVFGDHPRGAFLRDMSVGANQRTLLIGDSTHTNLETIRTTRLS